MKRFMRLAGRSLKNNDGRAIGGSMVVMGLLCVAMLLCLVGCGPYAAPGETSQERALRHKRVFRINQGEMFEDIDRVLMLDRPSGLSENRLP